MDPLSSHLERQIEHSRDFFWHRIRWLALADYLPADRPFTLLDVGAGIGLVGDLLARENPMASYRFIEPIDFLERRLEETYGGQANLRGAETYAACEVVALLDVLEHQEDDREFMHDLITKLDAGSLLVVTVPALQRLWSDWDVNLGHFRRYDKQLMRQSVADLPVDLVELSYLFPEMLPAAWVRARRRDTARDGSAEFPDLPKSVNEALFQAGRVTLGMRRRVRAGTSLMAVLRRR